MLIQQLQKAPLSNGIKFMTKNFVMDQRIAVVLARYRDDLAMQTAAYRYVNETLKHAVCRRKAEHIAGRICAERALAAAGLQEVPLITSNTDGSPQWPAEYCGSISHSHGIACAVVAKLTCFRSLGIDIEKTVNATTRTTLFKSVMTDLEVRHARAYARLMTEEEYATIVFSAKESLFKCLYPLLKVLADWKTIEIPEIKWNGANGTFRYRLLETFNKHFYRGFEGQGEIATFEGYFGTFAGVSIDEF